MWTVFGKGQSRWQSFNREGGTDIYRRPTKVYKEKGPFLLWQKGVGDEEGCVYDFGTSEQG